MNFNKAIEKSLIDKNIQSFEYNPSIVTNTSTKHIKNRIQSLLNSAKRVDIAVSYVVWSGLSLIYNDLKKFDSTSRLILTIDGNVTDILSLKKLFDLDMQVKVYCPHGDRQGFHLKSYLFESDEKNTLFIGSANISSRAFGMVHEMGTEIDSDKNGYIIKQYKTEFESLWYHDFSKSLSHELINNYAEIHLQKKMLRNKLEEFLLTATTIQPNYMQENALKSLEQCREVWDRGLVIAATGTGKTYLSAFDVKNSQAKKILFLVHNRLILTSAIKTYQKIFPNKKIIELNTTNKDQLDTSDFVFTTDKTAFNHLYKKIPANYFDYIIYDEAHKIGLNTHYSELINYFQPKFTLGITATPERTDNPKYLFETFKYQVPYEIRLLDAMNHELICPLTYYGLSLESKLLENNEQFNYTELSKYIKSLIQDKGHYGEKLKCLVFCSSINEAKQLSDALKLEGYNSVAVVSGKKQSREEIDEHIYSLQSNARGSLEIICTVNKFNEGIDIPDVNTILMLRNTTSPIIYLQQLGRGLRKTYDPHKYVTVFDIIGNSNKNYSIAQVLTGNETVDKRELYKQANTEFETVSPFINVVLEKQTIEKIIRSISSNFNVMTELKRKFDNELHRFYQIPTLKEMYRNPNFKELDLLQLLYKNFYTPFEAYYNQKYKIESSQFISNFFSVICQFVFRSYDQKTLDDYIKILKGIPAKNDVLRRILLPQEFEDGQKTAINSEYNKTGKNFPSIFEYSDGFITISSQVIERLNQEMAYDLFLEHIELFEYLVAEKSKQMQSFDLMDKAEFLFNSGSNDLYMNAVGERIDKINKAVYCTIEISDKESYYDNYISGSDTIVYHTQGSVTEVSANEKINLLLKENYKFYIAAQFPHLGYGKTCYFNLGNVTISKVSDVSITESRKHKFNHTIEFKLEAPFPKEFLGYNTKKAKS